jgi:hypothetical protein
MGGLKPRVATSEVRHLTTHLFRGRSCESLCLRPASMASGSERLSGLASANPGICLRPFSLIACRIGCKRTFVLIQGQSTSPLYASCARFDEEVRSGSGRRRKGRDCDCAQAQAMASAHRMVAVEACSWRVTGAAIADARLRGEAEPAGACGALCLAQQERRGRCGGDLLTASLTKGCRRGMTGICAYLPLLRSVVRRRRYRSNATIGFFRDPSRSIPLYSLPPALN